MASSDDIVLFNYDFSPFGKRIEWYLQLAGIPYKLCTQPSALPRPDLTALGINHRRIPILAHGRDIFIDTRAILAHLNTLVPASSPMSPPSDPTLQTLNLLISHWSMTSLFLHAAMLIPEQLGMLDNKAWVKDRESMTGTSWSKDTVAGKKPDALLHIREAFEVVENLLSDGRDWAADKGTSGPSQTDIEAAWVFIFVFSLGPGAYPEELISEKKYPRVFAYVDRFRKAAGAAQDKHGKAKEISGDEAAAVILGAKLGDFKTSVDAHDPLAVGEGEQVNVYPSDWGFVQKDTGALLALNEKEAVILVKSKEDKEIRIHYPRTYFSVDKIGGAKI